MKTIAQMAKDPAGYPTGGITPTTTLDEANKIIEQAGSSKGGPTTPPARDGEGRAQ